jgi:endonuclease/exonuclease/phosphatase family metal-dependent hydrolase
MDEWTQRDGEAMRRSLRVMTLNCWNVSEPFAERMALVRAEIARVAPDVIGFQEIVVRHDGLDQARVVLEGLGYEHVFGPAHRWDRHGRVLAADRADGDAIGNAIASRWPIGRTEVRPLPGEETGERRSIVGALVEAPGGVVPFFATHLNWKLDHGHVRERQVLVVAEFVHAFARQAPAGALPPVLVGDFNAEPDSTEVRFLCGLASLGGRSVYFLDAWRVARPADRGATWDNRNRFAALSFEPDRRIDYVFVGLPDAGGRGRVDAAALAFDTPTGATYPSDHFGVVADVRI